MLEDWKNRFRQIELDFFDKDPDEWPTVFDSKLEDLDDHYTDRHEGHVLILNSELELFPPLENDHFGKGVRVRDLQRDYVEPRVQGQRLDMRPVVPESLRGVNFGRLLVRVEGEGDK
jgi:hypothetical protein